MKEIYSEAEIFGNATPEYTYTVKDFNKWTMDYFRQGVYNGGVQEALIFGEVNQLFLDYLREKGINDFQYEKYTNYDPDTGYELDFDHIIATLQAHLLRGFDNYNQSTLGDVGGWCGDFISLVADYYNKYTDMEIEAFIDKYCATEIGNKESTYGLQDYISDIDAFLIFTLLNDNTNMKIYEAFEFYYFDMFRDRYNEFYVKRQGGSQDSMYNLALNAIKPANDSWKVNLACRGVFGFYINSDMTLDDISDIDKDKFATSYCNKQITFL